MQNLTKSMEDFLEAMLVLEEKGEPLESTRVAAILKVSKPAVHQMGHELIKRGLITREDYGPLALTEQGRDVARKTLHRHITIKNYLISIGVDEKTAEEDCCEIEHVISEETFHAIERLAK